MSHRNELVQAKAELALIRVLLAITLTVLAFQFNGWWTIFILFLAAGYVVSAAQDINKARKLRKAA